MRKIIILAIIIIKCTQLSVAQKIYLTYKIRTADSLFEFKAKAFSNTDIQTKTSTLFQKYISNNEIISIEDNAKRRFILFDYHYEKIYPNQLNTGFYTLYEYGKSKYLRYYIVSKGDTLLLEKPDLTNNNKQISGRNSSNYGKLVMIAKDYPEVWNKAKKVKFNSKDILSYITELNSNFTNPDSIYNSNCKLDFLGFSLKGFVTGNKTNIIFDVYNSKYFIGDSPNVSLRYGLRFNYIKTTEFLYSSWADPGHYETLTGDCFELPLSFNFEKTNSLFTPFISYGLAPVFYFRQISKTDSFSRTAFYEISKTAKFTFNFFASLGVKLKLSDSFNLMTAGNVETLSGANFLVGFEYYFKPRMH
jgi:hypothetical protein